MIESCLSGSHHSHLISSRPSVRGHKILKLWCQPWWPHATSNDEQWQGANKHTHTHTHRTHTHTHTHTLLHPKTVNGRRILSALRCFEASASDWLRSCSLDVGHCLDPKHRPITKEKSMTGWPHAAPCGPMRPHAAPCGPMWPQ